MTLEPSEMTVPCSSHAKASDFCAIFESDMNTFYSLALVLTRNHNTAEQCFLAAFHECVDVSVVSSGRERSWSRRAIVKQAIRLVRPRVDDSDDAIDAPVLGTEQVPRLLEPVASL